MTKTQDAAVLPLGRVWRPAQQSVCNRLSLNAIMYFIGLGNQAVDGPKTQYLCHVLHKSIAPLRDAPGRQPDVQVLYLSRCWRDVNCGIRLLAELN